MMSVSFDPFTKLENVPQTPKQRYEIMNKEMGKPGIEKVLFTDFVMQ